MVRSMGKNNLFENDLYSIGLSVKNLRNNNTKIWIYSDVILLL